MLFQLDYLPSPLPQSFVYIVLTMLGECRKCSINCPWVRWHLSPQVGHYLRRKWPLTQDLKEWKCQVWEGPGEGWHKGQPRSWRRQWGLDWGLGRGAVKRCLLDVMEPHSQGLSASKAACNGSTQDWVSHWSRNVFRALLLSAELEDPDRFWEMGSHCLLWCICWGSHQVLIDSFKFIVTQMTQWNPMGHRGKQKATNVGKRWGQQWG